MAAEGTHKPGVVWRLKPITAKARVLAAQAGLSLVEAQVLINRGINDGAGLRSFLSPRLSSLLDPMLLKDMDRAVLRMIEALECREPITVYGDYDADGLTAAALLVNFLTRIGAAATYYIPNRLTEGYGLNASAAQRLASRGGLLVTVDCGISNQEEVSFLQSRGMKVIVTDHHQVPEDFEPSCPVIDPHRRDCPFPFKMLAGAGLAFFLAVALRSGLRERGWFTNVAEPDLREYLDLVALGTVADLVPLLDQNRILVSAGLERMTRSLWPGVKALMEVARLGGSLPARADELSFRLAPRLNACGRMGDPETGIRALTTGDSAEARKLSVILDELNGRRQRIEKAILEQIEERIPSPEDLETRRALVFAGRGWHRGVLGIVASKIAEKYCRPTVVLDIRENTAAGSARSIPGFDLYRTISCLKPLLTRFGGHTHAAGLSLNVSCIPEFSRGLEALARDQLSLEQLIPVIEVDAQMDLGDLDLRTVSSLCSFGPFGSGNPEPVFYTPSLEILATRMVGEKHLRLKLRNGRTVQEGIGFGLAGRIPPGCGKINAVYKVEINQWQGVKKVELKIVDIEPAGGKSKLHIVTSDGAEPISLSSSEATK